MKKPRVLRLKEVEKKIGLKKPTIYRMMKEGKFPRPIQLNERAVGWIESGVDKWIESRPAA